MKRQRTNGQFDEPETRVNSLRRGVLLALVLVFVAFAVHEIFGDNGLLALRQKRRQMHAYQQQIQDQRRQNHQLRQDIHALKYDPHTIERYAREQMHFARPGEIIYTFPRRPANSVPPNAAKNVGPKK